MPATKTPDRATAEAGADALRAVPACVAWEPVVGRVRKVITGLFPLALIVFVHLAGVPAPPLACLVAGFALVAMGVGVRLWAAGHLLKREALSTSGPYAHLRHPLYIGSIIAGAGFCLASGLWWSWAALGLLAVPIYTFQIRSEERYLAARFGAAFARYQRVVPRLIPRWQAARLGDKPDRFRPSLVLANREHHWSSAVILMAVALWLVRAL